MFNFKTHRSGNGFFIISRFCSNRFNVISTRNKTAFGFCSVFAVFTRRVNISYSCAFFSRCRNHRFAVTGYIGNTFGHCYLVSGFRYCEFNGRDSTFNAFKRIVYSVNKSEFYVVFADSRSAVIFGNGVKFACGNNGNLSFACIFLAFDYGQFYDYFVYRYSKFGFKIGNFYHDFRHVCGKFNRTLRFVSKRNGSFFNRLACAPLDGASFYNLYAVKFKLFKSRINGFCRISLYGYTRKRMSRKRQRKFGFRCFYVLFSVLNE